MIGDLSNSVGVQNGSDFGVINSNTSYSFTLFFVDVPNDSDVSDITDFIVNEGFGS